jgi:Secretion system C-terminal sorting domain
MKRIIIISISLFLINKVKAQIGVPINQCYIKYEYDNSGNRIKRLYYCDVAEIGRILNPNIANNQNALRKDNSGVNLFPNPVKDELKIEIPFQMIGGTVSIYDSKGIQVFKSILENENSVLQLLNFTKGIYAVMFDSKNVRVQKIIVKE